MSTLFTTLETHVPYQLLTEIKKVLLNFDIIFEDLSKNTLCNMHAYVQWVFSLCIFLWFYYTILLITAFILCKIYINPIFIYIKYSPKNYCDRTRFLTISSCHSSFIPFGNGSLKKVLNSLGNRHWQARNTHPSANTF